MSGLLKTLINLNSFMCIEDVERMKRLCVAVLCALFVISTMGVYQVGMDLNASGESPKDSANAFTILLVDADTNAWGTTSYYSTALTNIGAPYTLWDVYGNSGPAQGKPTSTDMGAYNVVIWVPDQDMNWDGTPFDATDENEVGAYLSIGGNFLLSNIVWTDFTDGSSYMYDPGDFAYDYMGLIFVNGWSGNEYSVEGVTADIVYDSWGPAVQDWNQGGWGGFPWWMSEDLTPTPSAVGCIMNDDGMGTQAIGGARLDGGSFRTVFWGFPFETIPMGPDADDLMNRTLDWFYSTPGLPQMTIDKTAPATANPGETMMYTIDYSCSNGEAYYVVITETYPPDVTFMDSNPPPSVGDNIWALGNLPPGTNDTIFINVSVSLSAIGIQTNQVDLSFEDSIGTVFTDSDIAVTNIINPTMQVTKWAPATACPGEMITYWINYSNTGTDWAFNIVITEAYPADVTFIMAIPSPDIGFDVWILPALAPGGSGSIQITVQIDLDALLGTNLNNHVTLDYENGAGIAYQDDASVVTVVVGPIMTLNKNAPPYVEPIGETISYHIWFTNIGNDWAYNLTLTEFYPTWVNYVSANPLPTVGDNVWVIPSVAPSDTVDIWITAVVDVQANGSLVNYVELDYENAAGVSYPTTNDTAVTYVMGGSLPIRINSNADFDAAHGVTGGNGTALNPWVIENYEINGTGRGNCIYVGNTTEHFAIRNCSLHDAGGYGYSTWPFYGDIGLILYNATNGIVENNTVRDCIYRGIYLYTDSCHNKVMNNTASGNDQSSIHLSNRSNENFVFNNTITGSMWGIISFNSTNNTLLENRADSCDYGYYLTNSTYTELFGNTGTQCINSGIYLNNANYNDIIKNNCSDNMFKGGIAVEANSNYNYIADNTCLNNVYQGIRIDASDGNTIENNTCSGNLNNGIYLTQSNGNTMRDNNCSYNANFHGISIDINCDVNWVIGNDLIMNNIAGVYVEASNGNTIIQNDIVLNDIGIDLFNSNNNDVYHNNFINNTVQAYDNGVNTWDNGYPSGGNYWSDYTGVDYNSTPTQDVPPPDGIGDTPYIIDGDTQDNYPLMVPWTILGPVHNIDSNEYFNTIQAAIDDLDTLNGHTIEVANGIYCENVVVDKSVTLIGENKFTTVIDASGGGTPVYITAHWVNISGFRIIGSLIDQDYGIHVFLRDYCDIYDNIITNLDIGIFLDSSCFNEIWGNRMYDNGDGDIYGRQGSDYNQVYDNHVSSVGTPLGSGFGVVFSFSCTANQIFDNYIEYKRSGIGVYSSDGNIIVNNSIKGGTGGIRLTNSDYNVINNNYIRNCTNGTYLTYEDFNNTINGNTIRDCDYGVYIDYVFPMPPSQNNTFFHNSFLGNTIQAFDPFNNYWDNGYPSGGNFWSDYSGVDLYHGPNQDIPGSDGIGDTNYTNIQGGTGAVDNYPLMAPFDYTECTIPLQQGWNLISLPVRQLNWSLDSVLSSIVGKWDCIQTFDTVTGTWISHNIYRPGPLNDLNELNHLKSYWINITESGVTLTVKGDRFGSPLSIPLYAGWNFVGYPSMANEKVGNAFWGTSADKVMVGDTSEPYNVREVDSSYFMQPGEGYIVHVVADSTWVVDW
jgi:uncharacterized repeat protein (TIGR01451 family)